MVRLSNLIPTLGLLTPLVLASSAVLDLIPSNFDDVVLKSGKPTLVEFFAPWCGHCKNLAPVYEELASSLQHASSKVQIAKVDADANKDLGKRFGVQGFPTLKYFDGKSETPTEYNSGRDLESLQTFIKDKTGVKAKAAPAPKSDVEMLTDSTFSSTIGGDKDVLIAFTAPWCGHCKSLAPIWEKLATDFAPDSEVVIAKVDAEGENSKATAQAQGVTSYPTIKFFPRGSTEPEPYAGARNEEAFIEYINSKSGLHRTVGGGLDAKAGTIDALDSIVKNYVISPETLAKITSDTQAAAKGLQDKYAEYYIKVLNKLSQNKEYLEKESKRLQGLLGKSEGMAREKVDDLKTRSNILKKFLGEEDESKVKDEL